MDLELQHSTMEVNDSSGSEIQINIFDDPALNEFFLFNYSFCQCMSR